MAKLVRAHKGQPSPEEIALKRAARAQKKADLEAAEAAEDGVVHSHALVYSFAEHSIEVLEDWSGEGSPLAGMQWLGGVTLARLVDDRSRFPQGWFRDRRVLEVGAGVGMTSVLLALLGARVTCTDMDLTKAEPNVEANLAERPDVRERLELVELDWYNPELTRFDLSRPFDMIVAGDCCYEPAVGRVEKGAEKGGAPWA